MPKPDLTRRRFLGASAASAALAAMPPSLRRILAESAGPAGSLDDVEHVIMFMQENRPFDMYFGKLAGVRGFDDTSVDRSVFKQPDPKNPDGHVLPFHIDTFETKSIRSLSHAWSAQHHSWHGGKMDGFVTAHREANKSGGPLTMGYYERSDIPFHYALADSFTVCDHYHCSVMGPTRPNRLYAQTGTIDPDGSHGGPVIFNDEVEPGQLTYKPYAQLLEEGGVPWRMYWLGPDVDHSYGNMLVYFDQFWNASHSSSLWKNGIAGHDLDDFRSDVENGKLPQVSWLQGPYPDSEHPDYLPADGATYIYDVLEILAQHPDVWKKTVLFLTYDENDGYFDHVKPPTAPDGTPGEYVTVDPLPKQADGIRGPIGLGFRVPMLVISPWTVGGKVSTGVFDHTSMLRFCEKRFGVHAANISDWRRSTTGDLTSALNFSGSKKAFPTLGDPKAVQQRETGNAGKPDPSVPKSQAMPKQDQDQPWPEVARGALGRRVTSIQHLLRAHGASLSVDGDFGQDTEDAVKAFQKAQGLMVTGVVEATTFAKLVVAVQQGSTGDAVKAAQAELSVHGYALSVDGEFGPTTQAKVNAFQKLWLQKVTGAVKADTWRALIY